MRRLLLIQIFSSYDKISTHFFCPINSSLHGTCMSYCNELVLNVPQLRCEEHTCDPK